MTESKAFNRFSTIVLGIMVVISLLPILLIVIASFSDETALINN